MIFYCDYEGGNDSNDGTSFSLRWKTLTLGATAARIAPGDTIRMMASPDPTSLGQSATWTDGPLPATFVPTSSTNATPIVFTKVGHGLVTGDTVIVNGHTTNTSANGVWDVTVSGNTFTLLNADGSNSVGNGVGGASGTVRKITNSVVKLASAITANIASFGNQNSAGNAAWTASANVTSLYNTPASVKEGCGYPDISIAAGFTTGLAAYFPTGTLDLSGYQQVSFWIDQTSGTLGAAASCSLALCSDAAGTTVVNTINIPALGALARWSPITVDLGSALGASIQSIAFIVNTDNGAQRFLVSNIIACKASSAADSLSNTSLIGKNTGTEGWYGLQSINGTRAILDMDTNCIPGATPSRGYSGVTETVTTYKKETTKTVMAAAAGTVVQQLMDLGALGSPIIFSGGWNRTDMSTLTGDTIFDGQNGLGVGVTELSKAYIDLSVSAIRYSIGISLVGSTLGGFSNLTCKVSSNNTDTGISLINELHHTIIADNVNNNLTYGVNLVGTGGSNLNNITLKNCNSNLWGISNGVGNKNKFNITSAKNNGNSGIIIRGVLNKFKILDSSGNGASSIYMDGVADENYLINSTLNSAVRVAGMSASTNPLLLSTNENGNTNTHFGYTDGGLISSDIATVHTAGGMSWKLSPLTTNRNAANPLPLKVATGATPANTPITCNVWFRRSNTGLTARLVCKGGQLTGVDDDVIATMTAAADTWEQLSVSVTPSQKGVLEFYAECFGGTIYNCWVDDVSFS